MQFLTKQFPFMGAGYLLDWIFSDSPYFKVGIGMDQAGSELGPD